MISVLETAANYGPKLALVPNEPGHKHGSEVADRLVMTSAEQCSDLDQDKSGRFTLYNLEEHSSTLQFNPG